MHCIASARGTLLAYKTSVHCCVWFKCQIAIKRSATRPVEKPIQCICREDLFDTDQIFPAALV